MNALSAVFAREFKSYFATPLAFVFIVIFLFAMGAFTFYLGHFYENGSADLTVFFGYQPWLYLFLVPALAMRLWACPAFAMRSAITRIRCGMLNSGT